MVDIVPDVVDATDDVVVICGICDVDTNVDFVLASKYVSVVLGGFLPTIISTIL